MRFWLSVAVARLVVALVVLAGRVHDHRRVPAPPPPVVPVGALFTGGGDGEPELVAVLISPWWDPDAGVLVPMPLRGESAP